MKEFFLSCIVCYIVDAIAIRRKCFMKRIRHMIIARLIERIDVEEGNKITIKYRVSFEQFMNKKQASA